MTGLSGLFLKYLSHRALNSGPISFSSSSVGRICIPELICCPNRTQWITDLEPSINGVGGQARLLGTYFPFGEKLQVDSVCIVKVASCSPYLLLRFLVAAQEVIESSALIGDTVDY